mmetsp:Transcript_15414/g.25663  ORF Transcript_15414/g.25663 Transcript_15414/m.25663 type:complete len:227 (-) Transcript_15414:359-1039(-)
MFGSSTTTSCTSDGSKYMLLEFVAGSIPPPPPPPTPMPAAVPERPGMYALPNGDCWKLRLFRSAVLALALISNCRNAFSNSSMSSASICNSCKDMCCRDQIFASFFGVEILRSTSSVATRLAAVLLNPATCKKSDISSMSSECSKIVCWRFMPSSVRTLSSSSRRAWARASVSRIMSSRCFHEVCSVLIMSTRFNGLITFASACSFTRSSSTAVCVDMICWKACKK